MIRKTTFYYIYTSYRDIAYADEAVRAAVSGKYERLSEIPDRNRSEDQLLSKIIFQLALIKNDDELYDIMTRNFQTDMIISENQWVEEAEKYFMLFIKCCFDGTPHQLGSLLKKIMQPIYTVKAYDGCSVLLYDPLYWLMISGAYKNPDSGILESLAELSPSNYIFLSAVINDDKELIDIIFRNGFLIDAKVIADLICYPKAFSRLAEQFGQYFLPRSDIDITDTAEIAYAVGEEYLTEAAGLLYVSSHADHSQGVPDLNIFRCRIKAIFSSDLRIFLDENADLADIFAPELTIYIDELINVSEYERMLHSKIKYIITENVWWNDPTAAAELINRSPEFESDNVFLYSVLALLGIRSKKLLAVMLKKGYINNITMDAAISFLSNSHQLDAIRTINCFFNRKNRKAP